jgi:hypothetical protein
MKVFFLQIFNDFAVFFSQNAQEFMKKKREKIAIVNRTSQYRVGVFKNQYFFTFFFQKFLSILWIFFRKEFVFFGKKKLNFFSVFLGHRGGFATCQGTRWLVAKYRAAPPTHDPHNWCYLSSPMGARVARASPVLK